MPALSPYLFILCVEILGNAIRNCDQIKGICVFDSECKISQYADDTTLILDGSEKSMQKSFGLLDSFASISGLRINYEKTEALWIGAMRFQRRKIAAYQNISWPSHKVKALGVWLSTVKVTCDQTCFFLFLERRGKKYAWHIYLTNR